MDRGIVALLLAVVLGISACASNAPAEDTLRSERDGWAEYALQLEDELVRLNWDVCTALWDWAYSVDPSWEDETSARLVGQIEVAFEYWREDNGRFHFGQHEGQEFYDGFCYWG